MGIWASLVQTVERRGRGALVTVAEVRGSAPREPGARMLVEPDGGFRGTIGGGELEWRAIAAAREAIAAGPGASLARFVLGPDLGQCCGGTLRLLTEVFDESRLGELRELADAETHGPFVTRARLTGRGLVRERVAGAPPGGFALEREAGDWVVTERFSAETRTLLLFGAGHVGRALMLALAPLPFSVRWIDTRADAFPAAVPANVSIVHASDPARELANVPAGAFVAVMTHSHALDLAIVRAALERGGLGYVGLIGSASKRARFASRLRAAGLAPARIDALVCPIGIGAIRSKQPAVIAAAVAAQLLERDEACAALPGSKSVPVNGAGSRIPA